MQSSTKAENDSENPHERNRIAQLAWRTYCKNPDAVDFAFTWFNEAYPGIKPEAFKDDGNERTRKAYNLLRGNVGRLRVLIGEPLEFRRVNYSELPELACYRSDIFAQFEPELANLAFEALTRYIGGPFWGVIERGRINLCNHVHIAVKRGTCKLGVSRGVIQDADLPRELAYLCKNPEWQHGNAMGYLSVKQANGGKRVAYRYSHRGLGTYRPSLAAIEQALGFSLSRPVEADEASVLIAEPEQLVHAALPLLRDATSESLELVRQLHQAWMQGFYEGRPANVGAAKTSNLAHALGHYFARSWLSPGEVYGLEQLALSLGLHVADKAPARKNGKMRICLVFPDHLKRTVTNTPSNYL